MIADLFVTLIGTAWQWQNPNVKPVGLVDEETAIFCLQLEDPHSPHTRIKEDR